MNHQRTQGKSRKVFRFSDSIFLCGITPTKFILNVAIVAKENLSNYCQRPSLFIHFALNQDMNSINNSNLHILLIVQLELKPQSNHPAMIIFSKQSLSTKVKELWPLAGQIITLRKCNQQCFTLLTPSCLNLFPITQKVC